MKMKKEIVTIFVFIVLIIGVSLIYVILNPFEVNNSSNEDNNYKFDDSNYYLVQEKSSFKEYALNDLVSLDLYIANFNIKYKNN